MLNNHIVIVLTIMALTIFSINPAPVVSQEDEPVGMANPASVYCEEHGGTEETVEDDEGNQIGMCTLPDGTVCGSWAFYRGECPAPITCGPDEKLENGVCVPKETEEEEGRGGCLIATATFGSELAPQVQFLREIRDNTVLSTASGTSFMTAFNSFYYSFSPAVADLERQNPMFKETVKVAITPLLSSLSLLQYVDIDSEAEILGYGIGIILLNIGMYFVGPAFLIVGLKSKFSKIYA